MVVLNRKRETQLVVSNSQEKRLPKVLFLAIVSYTICLSLSLSQSHSFIHAALISNFTVSSLIYQNKTRPKGPKSYSITVFFFFFFFFLTIPFSFREKEKMSEFSFPPTTNNSKKTKFSSLLLSDLFLFCSFILSHPLYFSYFVFFSPYIVKVFSFLSPLFITTFLLLLALFTTLVNDNSNSPESSDLKVSFLLATYQNVLDKLRSNACHEDHEFQQLEELEAYKIVFEAPTLELLEQGSSSALEEEPIDKYPSHESNVSDQGLVTSTDLSESLAETMKSESLHLIAGGKRLEGLLKEENYDESLDEKGEKEVKAPSVESNKGEEEKEEPPMKSGSKAIASKVSEVKESNADHNGVVEYLSKVRSKSQRLGSDSGSSYDNGGEYSSKFMEGSQPLGSNNSLGSFGSMRKEKEWKRTLACKLFEERHNVNVDGGAEGMDLLWETYETDSNKVLTKSKTKKKKGVYNQDDEDDYAEEEELDDGQLCCLQALKFSAGKMNLGMGRPNLVKISKALKGFGWLHHVTKHGSKKVYP